MPRTVWAQLGADGFAERIFKTQKQAAQACDRYAYVLRSTAVEEIRRKVWNRAKHTCEHCGNVVSWYVMQLHEFIWRGRGGEVSFENGRCLCADCHQNDVVAGHGSRKVLWSK